VPPVIFIFKITTMKRFNPAANAASSPPEAEPAKLPVQPLVVGTRVHCILYGGMDGIVYEIVGEQKPETIAKLGGIGVMGGNADFRIVFIGERAHRSTVPESLVLGSCQWSIEDGIATADEIKIALAAAEEKKQADEAKLVAVGKDRAEKRAALPKLYPWLETIAQQKVPGRGSAVARTKSTHALGAANLKTELQREFPGVKFSVKSESYAGGDAIRVHWDFGPTGDEVTKLTDKYREGDFDGMTDSYDYNHDNVWPDVFGGAKYVTESRGFVGGQSGTDLYEQVGRALCALQRVEYQGNYTGHLLGQGDDRDLMQHVNGLLHRTHFPVGAKFKGVEYTPDAERVGHNWCRIVFELPPPATTQAAGAVASAQVIETEHTKLKHKLFVVQLGTRVERATYDLLNREAKALGGYYSSYRRDGAIPGFLFKTREPAEKFKVLADGHQPNSEPPALMPANLPIVPPLQPSAAAPITVINLGGPAPLRPNWRQRFFQK
jgi:hypothetical protein